MNIGLIFDMNGVIIDDHHFHWEAWKVIAEKYNKCLDEDSYREHVNGRTLKKVVQFIFDEPLSEERIKEIGDEKEILYRQLYQPYIQPIPGLLKLLSEVSRENIPMVVGTSAPKENVSFTMNGIGIRHYFVDVLDDRVVSHGKPDPEIYIKCAQAMGMSNENCVVFEDAPSGIKAGIAAGSKVIALATSYGRDQLEADLIIDNFDNISLKQILSFLGK